MTITVDVCVGVSVGREVDVMVFVDEAVGVVGAILVKAGIGGGAGVHASKLSISIATINTANGFIFLCPFPHTRPGKDVGWETPNH